ncbi:MAG: hypothetical protein P4L81_03460 [Candidatus Pacebacteria bacterium]|nr:hypothetical protein [Candidatus Paceibacterota bacterium]
MLTAIVTVLLSFILSGIAGNYLLHGWQHRNWLEQQHLMHEEKEFAALQELFDEIASLAGRRHFRMFRLLSSARGTDLDLIRARLGEYDQAVISWNERLSALYAKLTMQIRWRNTQELEDIQATFVSLGHDLEAIAGDRLSGETVTGQRIRAASATLNALQGKIGNFNKHLLRFINKKRAAIYEDIKVTEDNLDRIPTWELFKALFKSGVQRNNVI